ncbi:hypothetical protein LY76DRAFT_653078 [Colletotrichum caudatum]|nr:hypothetical protein LY76DRAFT_653078 [Colletotrichum caudatum]
MGLRKPFNVVKLNTPCRSLCHPLRLQSGAVQPARLQFQADDDGRLRIVTLMCAAQQSTTQHRLREMRAEGADPFCTSKHDATGRNPREIYPSKTTRTRSHDDNLLFPARPRTQMKVKQIMKISCRRSRSPKIQSPVVSRNKPQFIADNEYAFRYCAGVSGRRRTRIMVISARQLLAKPSHPLQLASLERQIRACQDGTLQPKKGEGGGGTWATRRTETSIDSLGGDTSVYPISIPHSRGF